MKLVLTTFLIIFLSFYSKGDAPTLNQWVYYELVRFDTRFEQGDLKEAEEILFGLYEQNWRRDSYDKAVIARTFGFYLIQQERYDEGFEKLLVSYETGAFPLEEQARLVVTISQLYAFKKQLEKSITFLEEYLSEVGKRVSKIPNIGEVYGMLALAYAQKEDFDTAYKHISSAVKYSGFREDWYKLKFAIEYTKGLYLEAQESAFMLVKFKPDVKRYYIQLSAIYNILEKNDLALATLEVSYLKNLLDKPDDFLNLSNFYLYNQNPANSDHLIEEKLDKGEIDATDNANLKLLSDAWLYAKDRSKSVVALEKAIDNEYDEELLIQLIDVAFFSFMWEKVINAYDLAKQNEIDTTGKIDLIYAISNIELRNYTKALTLLKTMTEHETYGDQATSWMEYLNTIIEFSN